MNEGRGRVAFKTLGCKVNQYDTAVLREILVNGGYQVVSFDSKADIYIINTCTVTAQASQKSRKMIRQAKKTNPRALVVAAGCYSQLQNQRLQEMEAVDLLVGTKDRGLILHYLATGVRGNQVSPFVKGEGYEDLSLSIHPHRTRAYLKIQEGCENCCSYCIVPQTRGPVRSRPYDSVLREAEALLEQGFKELILTGIHLGAYGEGLDVSLLDVIKGILCLDSTIRLRLSSLEITEVDWKLVDLFTTDSGLCPHLHLPLQSGSARILEKMGRPYSPDAYLEKVLSLQEAIPSLSVTTDIMVGFPGEGPEDFTASYQLAQQIGFLHLHVFPYSRRPGTLAAEMEGQVPSIIKKKRLRALIDLSRGLTRKYQQGFLGETQEVYVEGGEGTVLSGLTRNYMRVFFWGEERYRGTFLPVLLHRLTDDGIWGTIQKKGVDYHG